MQILTSKYMRLFNMFDVKHTLNQNHIFVANVIYAIVALVDFFKNIGVKIN